MTYLYFYIEPNIKLSPHNADSQSRSAQPLPCLGPLWERRNALASVLLSDVPQQRN